MALKDNSFKGLLTRSNKSITADRANRIAKGAKREYKRTLDKKEEEIDAIDEQIDRMLDLSASNSTMIDNKARDFNAAEWVKQLTDFEIKKEMLSMEVSVIKEKIGKYFEDESK
tara:strand:+ start:3680 stop:4021 length:342 start_codon:yes stop_codon:yes gene_type:complete